ncbi:hypothetical protein BJ508DRAFT_333315 [Ascobolus immersus RN42]|uniref:Uncharacterized protein n=1 Tax=Ascobolus immersus RN42 TaxID=1160509 RepID=A0A3N4HLT9_ASCIM|nr:hypothetical protein BJ508DRAFT_333315 [Ascobolus immersus RN42]
MPDFRMVGQSLLLFFGALLLSFLVGLGLKTVMFVWEQVNNVFNAGCFLVFVIMEILSHSMTYTMIALRFVGYGVALALLCASVYRSLHEKDPAHLQADFPREELVMTSREFESTRTKYDDSQFLPQDESRRSVYNGESIGNSNAGAICASQQLAARGDKLRHCIAEAAELETRVTRYKGLRARRPCLPFGKRTLPVNDDIDLLARAQERKISESIHQAAFAQSRVRSMPQKAQQGVFHLSYTKPIPTVSIFSLSIPFFGFQLPSPPSIQHFESFKPVVYKTSTEHMQDYQNAVAATHRQEALIRAASDIQKTKTASAEAVPTLGRYTVVAPGTASSNYETATVHQTTMLGNHKITLPGNERIMPSTSAETPMLGNYKITIPSQDHTGSNQPFPSGPVVFGTNQKDTSSADAKAAAPMLGGYMVEMPKPATATTVEPPTLGGYKVEMLKKEATEVSSSPTASTLGKRRSEVQLPTKALAYRSGTAPTIRPSPLSQSVSAPEQQNIMVFNQKPVIQPDVASSVVAGLQPVPLQTVRARGGQRFRSTSTQHARRNAVVPAAQQQSGETGSQASASAQQKEQMRRLYCRDP